MPYSSKNQQTKIRFFDQNWKVYCVWKNEGCFYVLE